MGILNCCFFILGVSTNLKTFVLWITIEKICVVLFGYFISSIYVFNISLSNDGFAVVLAV
jgi:hypothetical protein